MTLHRALPVMVLLAVFVALIGLPGQVHATHPDLVQLVIDQSLQPRTLYADRSVLVVQVDVATETLTVDSQRTGRHHWDGDTLWHTPNAATPPTPVPFGGERVRELWDEWRSGFAHTTFVPARPQDTRPDMRLPAASGHIHYWEVLLPFAWAEPWLVYVSVTDRAEGFGLTIIDRETDTFLADKGPCPEFERPPSGMMTWREMACDEDRSWKPPIRWHDSHFVLKMMDLDVPLAPETYSPEWPALIPTSPWYRDGTRQPAHLISPMNESWHGAREHVRLLPQPWNDAKGPVVHGTCTRAGQRVIEHGDVEFRFPDDPERRQLLRDAAAWCEDPRLTFSGKALLRAQVNQSSCVDVKFSIVDTRSGQDVVLMTRTFAGCLPGPVDDERPFQVNLPMPRGLDPDGLEVRVAADAEIRCQLPGGTEGITGFVYDQAPRFEWPGCYPGWVP
jgi:hypothetical protein